MRKSQKIRISADNFDKARGNITYEKIEDIAPVTRETAVKAKREGLSPDVLEALAKVFGVAEEYLLKENENSIEKIRKASWNEGLSDKELFDPDFFSFRKIDPQQLLRDCLAYIGHASLYDDMSDMEKTNLLLSLQKCLCDSLHQLRPDLEP